MKNHLTLCTRTNAAYGREACRECAGLDRAYEQGQRDERERITKAVEALLVQDYERISREQVLAAIKDSKGTHVTEEQT